MRKRVAQEGGDRCIPTVDSLHCATETNTTVYDSYKQRDLDKKILRALVIY